MKITKVSLTKHLKIGLPNYSNLTIGTTIEWEVGADEQFDFDKGWDVLNQQLEIQANAGTDPSWLRVKEYDKHYTATAKISKNGGEST